MLSATKQPISITLATTVGHFYVTLTLQTYIIWLDHLVLIAIITRVQEFCFDVCVSIIMLCYEGCVNIDENLSNVIIIIFLELLIPRFYV